MEVDYTFMKVGSTYSYCNLNLQPNQLEPFIEKTRFTPEDLNSGQMPGVIRLFEETTEVNLMTFIELAPWISAKTFVRVLTFLYTGMFRVKEIWIEFCH